MENDIRISLTLFNMKGVQLDPHDYKVFRNFLGPPAEEVPINIRYHICLSMTSCLHLYKIIFENILNYILKISK